MCGRTSIWCRGVAALVESGRSSPPHDVQGAFGELPTASLNALFVLLETWHRVAENSSANGMDAMAIAVAVAPCLAWSPPPTADNRKVPLIKIWPCNCTTHRVVLGYRGIRILIYQDRSDCFLAQDQRVKQIMPLLVILCKMYFSNVRRAPQPLWTWLVGADSTRVLWPLYFLLIIIQVYRPLEVCSWCMGLNSRSHICMAHNTFPIWFEPPLEHIARLYQARIHGPHRTSWEQYPFNNAEPSIIWASQSEVLACLDKCRLHT